MSFDLNRISFKKGEIADIDILIRYRILFLEEIQGKQTDEKKNLMIQRLKEYFGKAIPNKTFISWIAFYDNQAVSFGGMVIREQPCNFEIPAGKTAYILNMFTLKEFRKKGLGETIFQKLIDEGKSLDLDKIELHASLDGISVYRKNGFIEPHLTALELFLK